MTMATGDNDNDINGKGATGNKVDDDGGSATGNKVDDGGNGAAGEDNDNNNDGDGNGATGTGTTGYNDDNDGDGQWYNCVSMMYSTLLYCLPGRGAGGRLTNKHGVGRERSIN